MTSVQKFLRQRILTSSYLQAPINNCYYTFVATSGNYVGNYPPGYMQQAAEVPANKGDLIRDMGKTIKAVNVQTGGTLSANATPGFFREIQFISPVTVASATASSTFGVGVGSAGAQTLPSAGNVGDTGYGTYYIPIIIDGTIASDGTTVATLPSTYLPLGGQM